MPVTGHRRKRLSNARAGAWSTWAALCTSTLLPAAAARAIDVTFVEVTAQAGVAYSGTSFGQAWGDFNGDGFADLYVSNHGALPTLFRNQGGTAFIDDTGQIVGDFGGDTHGAAWADFDNDGDRDLLTLVGAATGTGERPNRFLLNNGGTFTEAAAAFGLDFPIGRGRTPLWFDWNNDGKLDALLSNWVRSDGLGETSLFTQSGPAFVDDTALVGINTVRSDDFSTLFMTPLSPVPQLLVVSSFPFPDQVYSYDTVPFVNTRQALGLPSVNNVQDVAIADFDGDLQQELYLARVLNPSEAALVSGTELRASLNGVGNGEIGIRFAATGPVTFEIGPDYRVALAEIRIGVAGISPESYTFELDPLNPDHVGTPPHELSENRLYVYYDQAADRWAVDVTHRLPPRMIVTAPAGVASLAAVNFTSLPGARTDVLLRYDGSAYVDVAAQAGVNDASSCESVAVADFDNDMDLDIFRACRAMAVNAPNQLLENDGSGHFTLVPGAAGASGTMLGRSDVVTAADYNNDGFIDLFVSNGRGDPPLTDGPSELFENQGNDNHWLAVELRGTTSNRDGVGTWAVLEAGGVAQSRLQANGMKRFGQDDQRLHFGLAGNTVVDTLTLRWPSGTVQVLENIAADQILTVIEPPSVVDSDGDGVANELDNCSEVANPDQRDADGDGFGNRCDADFDNDCQTNTVDLGTFKAGFFGADPVLDLDGDGVVNSVDLGILKGLYFLPPGPSGVSNACDP